MTTKNRYYSTNDLEELLNKATTIELENLSKIIHGDRSTHIHSKTTPKEIVDYLFSISGYLDAVEKVAKKMNLDDQKDFSIVKALDGRENSSTSDQARVQKHIESTEGLILKKVLQISYEKLSEEDKKKFDTTIKAVASEHGKSTKGLAGAAGLMIAANMGGFSTYMLMSSLLSAVSFGTLGFGAYTAASSILSTLIGPVGWAALGVYAIFKIGQPDYKKLIPAVTTIALVRQRVIYEEELAREIERQKRLKNNLKQEGNLESGKDDGVLMRSVILIGVFLIFLLLVMFLY